MEFKSKTHFYEKRKEIKPSIKSNELEFATYRKSGLTDETANQYLEQLLHFMETEKPFLNSKFKLLDLSAALNISTHNLSEIINLKHQKTKREIE